MRRSNYDKRPCTRISNVAGQSWRGWDSICHRLREEIAKVDRPPTIVAVECYPGVNDAELLQSLKQRLQPDAVILARDAMLPSAKVDEVVHHDVTDDPVFGQLTALNLPDLFDKGHLQALRQKILESRGLILIYGTGATLLAQPDLLIYANLTRWEAQLRFRRNESSNLGVENRQLSWSLQYKRGFFVDWRVCDRHKRELMDRWDFVLDTEVSGDPKMATGAAVREGLCQIARQPFRVVPFFDPAPWGGQWMKQVCDLDRTAPNYGWCFDCVPEENSLLLDIDGVQLELPAIDLVFYQPRELLGDGVYARFGAEFPIRFDFLDTMAGGNLSLQVHPLTAYIRKHFGISYTQDESYYLLDAAPDATVYLGLREDVDRKRMTQELQSGQTGGEFHAEQFVEVWPAKKHDHFLIPAGTVHCSGRNSLVLEISATPYIFTFKLWDWGRLGLDGKPRPIHLDHGLANIHWDRRTNWTRQNLVNRIEPLADGDGWREERTGLHPLEFIETRRHWFTKPVHHDTLGGVNVLNLVEGEQALVKSPTGAFAPFIVHYAETFIIPAQVGSYAIYPDCAASCATIKACVCA